MASGKNAVNVPTKVIEFEFSDEITEGWGYDTPTPLPANYVSGWTIVPKVFLNFSDCGPYCLRIKRQYSYILRHI